MSLYLEATVVSESGSASGSKVGSGSASNKNPDPNQNRHPHPHQGDKSKPDPHQHDPNTQQCLLVHRRDRHTGHNLPFILILFATRCGSSGLYCMVKVGIGGRLIFLLTAFNQGVTETPS